MRAVFGHVCVRVVSELSRSRPQGPRTPKVGGGSIRSNAPIWARHVKSGSKKASVDCSVVSKRLCLLDRQAPGLSMIHLCRNGVEGGEQGPNKCQLTSWWPAVYRHRSGTDAVESMRTCLGFATRQYMLLHYLCSAETARLRSKPSKIGSNSPATQELSACEPWRAKASQDKPDIVVNQERLTAPSDDCYSRPPLTSDTPSHQPPRDCSAGGQL